MSEDTGKAGQAEREEEAEDEEWGKTGWPRGLTAWMVKAGH